MSRALGKTSRLVLAVKTAIAAAVAWYLAPFVPFAEPENSYYAPLGVLVSMYATVFDSARSGLQALLGLGVGIALGLGGLHLVSHGGAPAVVVIAMVVVVGVTLGGLRVFGAGREWISVSGVFVLLLGGRDASEFSLSYLVTMAFGVVVGVLMQFLLVPPLFMSEAHARLNDFRNTLSACLREAAALVAGEQSDNEPLYRAVDDLIATAATVSDEVQEARRSERANPRARRHRGERQNIDHQFQALDQAALFVREIAGHVARRALEEKRRTYRSGDQLLAKAIAHSGDLISVPFDSPDHDEHVRLTREALSEYLRAVEATDRIDFRSIMNEVAAAACVQRIIDVMSDS